MDRVAAHGVPRARRIHDSDSIRAAVGNDIPFSSTRSANGISGSAPLDEHSVKLISKRIGAGAIHADVVAADQIPSCTRVGDVNAILGIAGNDVAFQSDGAA